MTVVDATLEECDHDWEDVCIDNGDGIYYQCSWHKECRLCGATEECDPVDDSDFYYGEY